jgi:hypothetical protein
MTDSAKRCLPKCSGTGKKTIVEIKEGKKEELPKMQSRAKRAES